MSTTDNTNGSILHLNVDSLYQELWDLKSKNPLEFTEREKELYNSPLFLNSAVLCNAGRELVVRLNKHPLIACCAVKYPHYVHLRVRDRERAVKEIFSPAIKRKLIGAFMVKPSACRAVLFEASFIQGFDFDGALHCLDPTNFVKFVEHRAAKDGFARPSDAVVSAIAGEDLSME